MDGTVEHQYGRGKVYGDGGGGGERGWAGRLQDKINQRTPGLGQR